MARLRKEYRIVLPVTVDEYKIAHLWSISERSKLETGGGNGVEIIVNEPSEIGQFTHKIWHIADKVPRVIRALAPKGSIEIHEKSWNTHPTCKTELSNPDYMKDGFQVETKTVCLPDLGESENVHNLPEDEWKSVEVVHIDFVNDPTYSRDYSQEYDLKLFKSAKTGRGPYDEDWKTQLKSQSPPTYMCVYKLVSVEFKWWGLQDNVESRIHKTTRRLFTSLHRQVVCWIDDWYGLSVEELRIHEQETKEELDLMLRSDGVRGMVEK
ncbi:unnamed protein product [Clavelina lepadiformis]|uniref:Phosphatidylinositol transfer protein N-terminal domain-containing protein n=1 Tax=Clavelina lepadiformis TaxID=159417 RepID=A0ABP0G2L9_CLALP